jgi:Flp pilus assembly protein TadD
MRGADLRAAREYLGATPQQIAQSAGVRTSEVEAWESFGEVPRKHRFAVDVALWELERDRALAGSGLPECEQLREWNQRPWEVNADVLARHVADCPVCEARGAYVEEHVRPRPIGGNPIMRLFGVANRLTGWMQSAFYGAMMLLMMGGIGVLVMLGQALLRQDVRYLGYAAGLFVLLVVSGAAGGIVHYLTGPLRHSGTLGYYASYMLTVEGYLLAVFGIFTLAALYLGEAEVAEAGLPTLNAPAVWIILLVIGVIFGVVVGRAFRNEGSPPAAPPPQRRAFSLRNVAMTLLFVAGIGLRYLAGHAGPTTPEQWEAALPELRAAVRENPEDPGAQRELAWALVSLDRWDEAGPVLREAVRLNPEDSDLLNSLGWADMEAGRVTDAVPLFRRSIAIDPENSRAQHNLGWAFYRLERFEEADSAFRAIVHAHPETASAHGALGWVLIATRRGDEAAREFRESLRLDSLNASYHRGLAVTLLQKGQIQEALASLRTAARLTPGDAGLWIEIGRLAHLTGGFEESVAAFEHANQLDSTLFADSPEARGMWEASRQGRPYVPARP